MIAAVLTLAPLAAPRHAAAQCAPMAPNCTLVRPDGKGIIGLGLIGAELGLIIPALAGVRDEWWPYLVFPALGAIGGAIGGWAVEQATPNDPEVDVVLMVVGLALVVPAIVGTLALTAYQPPDDAEESDEDYEPEDLRDDGGTAVEASHDESAPAEGVEGSGGAESGGTTDGSGASTTGPTSSRGGTGAGIRSILAGGRGLIRFELGSDAPRLLVAAPLPYSQSTYTAEERAHLLLNPANDFIVPVVSATF